MGNQRGFTLVELLIAIVLAGLGAAGLAAMLGQSARSTADMGAQSEAITLATRLMAEIQDAPYHTGTIDPGLTPGMRIAPAGGSRIRSVGDFIKGELVPTATGNESLRVTYEIIPCAQCLTPFAGGPARLGGIDVVVTVANANTHRRLLAPVHLMSRKTLLSTDGGAVRGRCTSEALRSSRSSSPSRSRAS